MKVYHCQFCFGVEWVSMDVERVYHHHPGGLMPLMEIPVKNINAWPAYLVPAAQVIAVTPIPVAPRLSDFKRYLKKLEFDKNKRYVILVDDKITKDPQEILNLNNFIEHSIVVKFISGDKLENTILVKDDIFKIQDWLREVFEKADDEEKKNT